MYKGRMRLKACMMLTIFVMTFVMSVMLNMKNNVETVNAATRTYFSYSQIKDTKKCDYVNLMMNYYVNNNTDVINALKSGKSVVMMFEGASNNITASHSPVVYGKQEKRIGALCVVLKYENGKAVVKYTSQACSTIPDQSLGYGKSNSKKGYNGKSVGSATLLDGVYKMVTCNHNTYAGLNVQTLKGSSNVPAVYMEEGGAYSMQYASGIDVHTRRWDNCSNTGASRYGVYDPKVDKLSNSIGCILISSANYDGKGFASYNNFIDCVYTINGKKVSTDDVKYEEYDVRHNIGGWNDAGVIVVDRYLYAEHLMTMYQNDEAVKEIVKNSFETYEKAVEKNASGGLKVSLNLSSKMLEMGEDFEISGVVSSNRRIKSVRGVIKQQIEYGKYNAIKDVTVFPNNGYYSLSSIDINDGLNFASLGAGDYMLVVEAKDETDARVEVTRAFSVYNTSKSKLKASVNLQATTIKKGNACNITGTITANETNIAIKKITGQIVNSSGAVIQEVIVYPNTYNNVELVSSDINRYLAFGQLVEGSYRLVITAEDYSGKVVKVQKFFNIIK